MRTTFRKFLKVQVAPNVGTAALQILHESGMIFGKSGFLQKPSNVSNEIEMYFQGREEGMNIRAFPKMSLGQNLFFGLEIDITKLKFTNDILPNVGEISLLEINADTEEKTEVNERIVVLKTADRKSVV